MRTCAELPSHLVLVTRPPQAGTGGAPSQLGGLQAADTGLHRGRAREAGRVGGRGNPLHTQSFLSPGLAQT